MAVGGKAAPGRSSGPGRAGRANRDPLARITFEVMPLKGTEDAVLAAVPTDVALTVTATERRGIGATVDLVERLAARGYQVAPHLAARLIADRRQLADVLARLDASGCRAFSWSAGTRRARPASSPTRPPC